MSATIAPALAYAFEEKRLSKGHWVAEQKWDGHRILIRVHPDGSTEAWSRTSKSAALPWHIRNVMASLPSGVYDGELCGGETGKSYDVSTARAQGASTAAASGLFFFAFDLLVFGRRDLTSEGDKLRYSERRELLEQALGIGVDMEEDVVVLSQVLSDSVRSAEQAFNVAAPVWARGGEGLILKETSGLYRPGKRMNTWLKIKKLGSAVVTIIGFEPGLMGERSIAVFQDDESHEIPVKWKDYEFLKDVTANGDAYIREGRRARIEFTERTAAGHYREPRFDRWLEEGE